MHERALTEKQIELFPLIHLFRKSFYLVGGTAIALHLGHRQSIDFDLFNPKTFSLNNSFATKPLRHKGTQSNEPD
jgi:hypothetical protein